MMHMKTKCWSCGFVNNRQSAAADIQDNSIPNHGDISLCFQCGSPAIYDAGLEDNVRKPTPKEMREIMSRKDVLISIWSIKISQAERKNKK